MKTYEESCVLRHLFRSIDSRPKYFGEGCPNSYIKIVVTVAGLGILGTIKKTKFLYVEDIFVKKEPKKSRHSLISPNASSI